MKHRVNALILHRRPKLPSRLLPVNPSSTPSATTKARRRSKSPRINKHHNKIAAAPFTGFEARMISSVSVSRPAMRRSGVRDLANGLHCGAEVEDGEELDVV
ncbi:hypothetical protein CNMCM6805_007513 [Aspergillus fumigatiaffinis]|uniref:Uncharacterized protein n=1 Tax=Aspergillus fumigatiaffinis TaxID=340414 RepID=A0A8H4E9M5_9EURO|nr:hypothetical protein CNMCM6457_007427 [Aspergillus fumigatiaffinis]KAF4224871.1 hypothetical protein CNMCM6805_007513 [Aspergillus fumigatiaffinis]